MKTFAILLATIVVINAGRVVRQATTTIEVDAALAAAGDGWAAEGHADSVSVLGAGGWGEPDAELAIVSAGESVVLQEGEILQITSQDGSLASSINAVTAGQVAAAGEGQEVAALGLEISNAQSGSAVAAGEGASAAAADSIILSAPNASGWGMAKP